MINAKDITAIIPTGGKREHSLRRAVMSVLSQTESVSKILVIWDGDNAPFPYLANLGDTVETVKTPVAFGGVSRARQLGIELAKTNLVCILDDDDYWTKTKISEQMDALKHHNNPHNIFSFCRSVLEYEDGTQKSIVPIQKFKMSQNLGEYFFQSIPLRNSRKTCSSSTYLFSRQLALNYPFKSDMTADEDTDFILRIQNECKVFYIHEILVHSTYRDSGGMGLSHTERNIEDWLKWIQGMSDVVEIRMISNIKIVYGVRHYLKQNRINEALRLWFSTLRESPDLHSVCTGLFLFLRKLVNR